ncbi:ankyrin repeat-containing domain protein [Xylariomycetidae sp. FL2044]|nr:ankyrin repeat-containing domain protein [Xylariomycetidae sp. FL2044]
MSFGFGIGDFLAVIKLANQVRKDFADAPVQFEQISSELRTLSIVLQDIDTLVSQEDLSEPRLNKLSEIVDSCHNVLQSTQDIIKQYCDLGSEKNGLRRRAQRTWKRLKWEPDDIRDLRSRIVTNITLLTSYLQGDAREKVGRLEKRQDKREHQDILDWLTPVDYAAQHCDFIGRRQAGTGQWLLSSPEFQKWVATNNEGLYCPGIPGAGKTISASIVIENLLDTFYDDLSVGVCYLYFNFRRKGEQTFDDVMRNLLKQLTQRLSAFPSSVKNLHARHKQRGTIPSTDEICSTLHLVASSYRRVFVVIDALDECQALDGSQQKVISQLSALQSKTGANVLATSRPISGIMAEFRGYTLKEIRADDEDVRRYILGNLSHLPRFVSLNLDLQEEIMQGILCCIDGMFLLAQLHLESLKGKRSPKAVRKAIQTFVKGSGAYDSAYRDAMERIQGQLPDQAELAMQALAWITCAKRPLTTLEIRHALAVELEEPDFDEENLPDLQDIVSSCHGLVTVDEESDNICLIHYTTQEFFERTQNIWFPDASSYITNVCLTYLSYQVCEGELFTRQRWFHQRFQTCPLYRYAGQNWGFHAKLSANQEPVLRFLALQLHIEAALAARSYYEYASFDPKLRKGGLHLAAFFDLDAVVKIIAEGQNLDELDEYKRTPLMIATKRGNESTARLLLELGADINAMDTNNETALIYAAKEGHEVMVRLLLDWGAEVDLIPRALENGDWTALAYAAQGGYVNIMRLLIEHGAAIESRAPYSQTSLFAAVKRKHESATRLLLENGAQADFEDPSYGRTPLSYAAERGSEGIVRLLLQHEVEVNRRCKSPYIWRTPLSFAAERGHENTARLLLEHGAEADIGDGYGRTPLSYAAQKGWETIARLLLENGAEADTKKGCGRTPLSYAAEEGHETTARLLLENGAEADTKQYAGRTPLSYAAQEGHETIARLLLENGADVNAPHGYCSSTPLIDAARKGNKATVQVLLKHGARANAKECDGSTALRRAAYEGDEAIIQLLLEHGAEAAEEGHETCVRLLLEHGAEVDAKDCYERTPLSYASEKNRLSTAELLLNYGAEVDSKDWRGQTPLYYAARWGKVLTSRLPLQHGANRLNNNLKTAQESYDWVLEAFDTDALDIDTITS